jgi:hypothetical protein
MNGNESLSKKAGGGGKDTIEIRGWSVRAVGNSESVLNRQQVHPRARVCGAHTIVSNQIHASAVLRYTHSMILHSRTSSNVSKNQDLNRDLGLSRSAVCRCHWW